MDLSSVNLLILCISLMTIILLVYLPIIVELVVRKVFGNFTLYSSGTGDTEEVTKGEEKIPGGLEEVLDEIKKNLEGLSKLESHLNELISRFDQLINNFNRVENMINTGINKNIIDLKKELIKKISGQEKCRMASFLLLSYRYGMLLALTVESFNREALKDLDTREMENLLRKKCDRNFSCLLAKLIILPLVKVAKNVRNENTYIDEKGILSEIRVILGTTSYTAEARNILEELEIRVSELCIGKWKN